MMYGVRVRKSDAERAKRILRDDAKKHNYAIDLAVGLAGVQEIEMDIHRPPFSDVAVQIKGDGYAEFSDAYR